MQVLTEQDVFVKVFEHEDESRRVGEANRLVCGEMPVWSSERLKLGGHNSQEFGIIGEEQPCSDPNFHDGLVCDSSMSLRYFGTCQSTFLNAQQELSSLAMLRGFTGPVFHLLSEVAANEGFEWWLLDSRAAVTVLAHQNLDQYGAPVDAFEGSEGNFCAANGSSVNMHGKVKLFVCLSVWGTQHEGEIWKHATVNSLVGATRHNILSTTVLSRAGWTFQQDWSGACFVARFDRL